MQALFFSSATHAAMSTQVEGRNASQGSADEKFDVEKDDHLIPAVVLADAAFDDPNLDKDAVVLGELARFYSVPNSDIVAEDDSPYPEVRSAVANTDDPDMPTSTIRSWVLGELEVYL